GRAVPEEMPAPAFAGATISSLGRRFPLLTRVPAFLVLQLAENALPAGRTLRHIGIERATARAVDLAGRLRRRRAVELLDVHRRQYLGRDIVRTVVVRRRRVVVAVGPRPVDEGRADEDHRGAMVMVRRVGKARGQG